MIKQLITTNSPSLNVIVWKQFEVKNMKFLFFQFAVFDPDKIPLDALGPFGSFTRYLVQNHSGLLFKG